MQRNLEYLKHQVPLLEYLMRHNWAARQVGSQGEFVGLCPLHPESHPSFYVNARKNVFYCHGCGSGGDIIRFVQLYHHLSFPQTIFHLKQELALPEPSQDRVLEDALAFYQSKLPEGPSYYLYSRGLCDTIVMHKMGLGYAPGGCLRRHLIQLGYPSDLLLQVGLINGQGNDTFYRRIVLPCFDRDRLVNLYGRSTDSEAPPHRFLPRPKGGLFGWNTVYSYPSVILVEGLFDLGVLLQAGFDNTTCAFGIHLSRLQFSQLCDSPDRQVFIAFDSDANGSGQNAARFLARRLADAGPTARIVQLPLGQDPNSYFVSGATADDFRRCLEVAEVLQ